MAEGARVMRLHSASPQCTRELGRMLGAQLAPGDCIGLRGELGAGKTAFAGGLGEGLGVAEPMRSPSYLLCCEHRGRMPVLHLDAYFEPRMEALLQDGLTARFHANAIIVIEWADRLATWWPADRLDVGLRAGVGPEDRELELRALGPRSAAALAGFAAALAAAVSAAENSEPSPPPAR